VVLLDQRGCGRSEPRGCLSDNHTDALVSDLELLRNHLRLGPWVVLGGSWGTTLALAYAQHHPGSVLGMILRGVCLMRPSEVDWLFRRGASVLRPLGWQHFLSGLAPVEQADPLAGYYSRFLSPRADQRDAAVSYVAVPMLCLHCDWHIVLVYASHSSPVSLHMLQGVDDATTHLDKHISEHL
jgi:proline iminopeptidase